MRHLAGFVLATLCVALSACSSISGTYPRNASIIPDAGIQLTPSYVLHLDDLVVIAGISYLVYTVVDPLAPNWSIQETRQGDNRASYELTMKPINIGGAGEAKQVLARRAEALARERGFGGYQLLRYEESIDSRIWLPHRTARAEIVLVDPQALR
ncbi:MAG: hypothetical protein QM803_17900 [Rhodocyclaceae bacterium]